MNNDIESTLRRLSIKQLEVLCLYIFDKGKTDRYISVKKALESISIKSNKHKSKTFGGIISSLSKIKVQGMSLILPAGKSNEDGMMWALNNDLMRQDALKKVLLLIPKLKI